MEQPARVDHTFVVLELSGFLFFWTADKVSQLARAEQAQITIKHWLKQYDHTHPHQALKMRPPVPEPLLEKPQVSGLETGG